MLLRRAALSLSEIHEVSDLYVETVGDAADHVESDAHAARLDLPHIRLVGSHHERERALRKPL